MKPFASLFRGQTRTGSKLLSEIATLPAMVAAKTSDVRTINPEVEPQTSGVAELTSGVQTLNLDVAALKFDDF